MRETNEQPGDLVVRRLASQSEADACARMMCASEPWVTLGRTYETALKLLNDPTREVYIARQNGGIAGFLILCTVGAMVGYIQTICLRPDVRGRGLGTRLMRFAEERILREFPNVFLCVSSFNTDAKRLYERLGYEEVGELKDFLAAGSSEILMRKTTGPINAGPAVSSSTRS